MDSDERKAELLLINRRLLRNAGYVPVDPNDPECHKWVNGTATVFDNEKAPLSRRRLALATPGASEHIERLEREHTRRGK